MAHRLFLAVALFTTVATFAASVPEPETIFYGKVLNRWQGHDRLLTQGQVAWTVRTSGGKSLVLRATTFPLGHGAFSYRLAVPQPARSLGSVVDTTNAVPLEWASKTHQYLAISVGGDPATMLTAGGGTFSVDQVRRASTFRLDVVIAREEQDIDGDGLPDWFEELYGLDLQNDDATPGTDIVTNAANANLLTSGAGTITVRVSRNVTMAAGSSFETVHGGIIIEANLQTTAATGNFAGIIVSGSILSSGTGTLQAQGRGGNDAAGTQTGVQVATGGIIRGGSGLTSVTGTGGGSGSGSNNKGVYVDNAGAISRAGPGAGATVTVSGTGGATTGTDSYGVHVELTSSGGLITSSGGNISVTGVGGGSGSSANNHGVHVRLSSITTTGATSTVTITGAAASPPGTRTTASCWSAWERSLPRAVP